MGDVSGVCILILCGLPASGKTSFIKKHLLETDTRLVIPKVASQDTELIGGLQTQSTGTGKTAQVQSYKSTSSEYESTDINPTTYSTTDTDIEADVTIQNGNSATRKQTSVVVVEYDSLLPQNVEAHLLSQTDQESSAWKQYRANIVLCVESLVSHLTSQNPAVNVNQSAAVGNKSTTAGDPSTIVWKQSLVVGNPPKAVRNQSPAVGDQSVADRKQSLAVGNQSGTVKNQTVLTGKHASEEIHNTHLASLLSKPEALPQELWDNFVSLVTSSFEGHSSNKNVCVVIDDNMYYRGMRYSYYQMARKYNTGFCQLYLDCDADISLSRNAQRLVRVADDVITTMATRMQPPDPTNNNWEKYSYGTQHMCDIVHIDAVYNLINQAMSDPVQPLPVVDIQAQTQSRLVCSRNTIHCADQHLRKLVAKTMVSAKDNGLSKDELQGLSTRLQARRKHILEQLRSGRLSVPIDITAVETSNHVLELVEILLVRNDDDKT